MEDYNINGINGVSQQTTNGNKEMINSLITRRLKVIRQITDKGDFQFYIRSFTATEFIRTSNNPHSTHLYQRGAKDRHEKALVHKVQQLLLYQRVRHLNHRIAKLQRIHEQRQGLDVRNIVRRDPVPVVGRNINGRGQGAVQTAETRDQDGTHGRALGDVNSDVVVLLRQGHAQQQGIACLVAQRTVSVHVRDEQGEDNETGKQNELL